MADEDFGGEAEPGQRIVPGVQPGAEPRAPMTPKVIFRDLSGSLVEKDLRVKIRVPPKYFQQYTSGPENALKNLNGIVFPYTPQISYEVKADYSPATPMHSNFAINFYQRSSLGAISINGKFTVENSYDAEMYLATLHLLRSLTKMRSGGSAYGDPDSGAAPPVCRLDAYGDMSLNNVPVVIQSVRVDLPDSVDYYTLPALNTYGINAVPTMSTLAIACLPMYSRNEMQQFNVNDYLNRPSYRDRGYV
jgi:hypothetical protein